MDEEGLEFAHLEAVEREAAKAMADAAASNFERPIRASESSIVVRDDNGLVMRVRFTVEIERLRGQ
ncbi:hypothetical protein [Bradyrhizobium sp. CCGB20]|uniref:DUF6894 family protein n=1 Tax=Bradyrhizobium sp. CCGB20 TaxID=2949633 RepID=UPI0035C67368